MALTAEQMAKLNSGDTSAAFQGALNTGTATITGSSEGSQTYKPSVSVFDASNGSTFNNTSVTNSSTPIDQAVNNLGNNINNVQSGTSDLSTLLSGLYKTDNSNSTDINKVYEDRQSQLEKRKQAELDRLSAEYDTAKATKEANYAKTVEPYQKRLQLLNDTPYGANALTEEDLKLKLNSLEQTHKLEMDNLFNQRQSNIALAQSAYEDKDFALAEAKVKNAKEAEKQIYDRQQDYLNMVLKFQGEQRQQQMDEFQKSQSLMKDAQSSREFAINNGISKGLYQIGNQVINTATGQPVDASQITDWSQVQVIDGNSKASADYVSDLAKKYPDTVFPTMTADQAQKAMQYSKIYKDQVRPPVGSTTSNKFKFSSSDTGRLLAAGLTNTQTSAIQTNLNNGYSIDEILKGFNLNDSQSKAVRDVMGGVTSNKATQPNSTYGQVDFEPWIWQNFPREVLSASAKKAGFKSDKNTDNAVDKYISSLISKVSPLKSAGNSDQDLMQALIEKINS